ncbi:MAG TPA: porin [Limnochordia bacterium]|nr:porin [Limnochordia bacterium]
MNGVRAEASERRKGMLAAMVLAAGLTLGFAGGRALAAPAAIVSATGAPTWVYAALTRLVDLQLVGGWPEDAFAKQHNLSRYELAAIVGSALDTLRKGAGVSAPDRVSITDLATRYDLSASRLAVPPLNESDIRLLVSLTDSFKVELSNLGYNEYVPPASSATDLSGEADLGRLGPLDLSASREVVPSGGSAKLDGTVELSSGARLSASVSRALPAAGPFTVPAEHDPSSAPVATVAGTLPISDLLSFSGEIAAKSEAPSDGAYKLGATVDLGEVKLNASYRAGDSALADDTQAAPPGVQSRGYRVSLDLDGGAALSAGRTQHGGGDGAGDTVTSLGISYPLRQAVLTAQSDILDLSHLGDAAAATRYRLGVNVPIPQGTVRVEYSIQQQAGIGGGTVSAASADTSVADVPDLGVTSAERLLNPSDEMEPLIWLQQNGADGTTRTADIGVEYKLTEQGSLLLAYQMVDFHSFASESQKNIAAAKFTLRF